MRKLVLAFLLFSSGLGWGQINPGNRLYKAEGRLVIFRILPAEKSAKIFLVGREIGGVKVGDEARLVSVISSRRGKEVRKLDFKSDGTAYEIPIAEKADELTLELHAEIRGQPDQVKIQVRKP